MVNPNGSPNNGGEGTPPTKAKKLKNMTNQELLESIAEKKAEERKKSKNRGSSVLGAIDKKLVTGGLAAAISLSAAGFAGYKIGKNIGGGGTVATETTKENIGGGGTVATVTTKDNNDEGQPTGEVTSDPEVIGIDDKAYFEPGQYFDMNADKSSEFAISEAETIAQSIGSHKLKDVTNEIIKVSENFSGYLAAMPEEHLSDDLKGIKTVPEFEETIESLSPEEYDELKKDYLDKLEKYATPALILVNGSYSSHYDALNFEGKYLGRKDARKAMDKDEINHTNMEAVGSKGIQKKNEIVLGYVWQDNNGNIIGIQPLDLSPELAEGYEYDANTGTITLPDGSKIQMIVNDALIMDEIGGEVKVVKEFKKRYCMQNLWTEEISASKLGDITIVEIAQDEPNISQNPGNNEKKPNHDHKDPDDDHSDDKNAEAIEQNMQTRDETNNYVASAGSGDLEARPDTSSNSYVNERNYQEAAREETWQASSESAYYETIGDVIEKADQSYATHENYTPEQVEANIQNSQDIEVQDAAKERTDAAREDAQKNEGMNDAQAAGWFNNLTNGGGQ